MNALSPTPVTIIARPLRPGEPDLLLGFEYAALRIVSEEGHTLTTIPSPEGGWTHDSLEAQAVVTTDAACDAYLDDAWVGSTEI